MIKKILKIVLSLFVLLIAAAFAIPLLFKDKIVAKVKTEINKNVLAKVDFADVDISLFRHFPRVAVALERIQVMGIDEFAKDTLLSAKKIDVSLALMSVISGSRMKVYGINVEDPRIHAIVTKEGIANWNIMKSDSTASTDTAASKPFSLSLKDYKITNGYVSYRDQQAGMFAEIKSLDHEGSGDFTADIFMLKTNTTAEGVSFSYASIPYLADARLAISSDFQVNNKINKYDFETGDITVNNLRLNTKGYFQIANDSTYKMDIAFNAPSTNFKDILSLIPVIYKNDFNKVKTSGKTSFDGFVKGSYNKNTLPAYSINLKIKDGFFQYADLPKPVQNVNIGLWLHNPDGLPDNTTLNISKAHLEMDKAPFDFRILIKNPVSDLYIDGFAKGRLDLSRITQFVKLSNGTKISGTIKADMSATGRISAIQNPQYHNQFYAAGILAINGLQYASADYPDGVKVNNLFTQIYSTDITISDLDGEYKKTHFSANGEVRDVFPYLLKHKTLHGKLQVKADNMNLNRWMGTTADTSVHNSAASEPFAVPANLDFRISAAVTRLTYDKLEIQNLKGNLTLADEKVTLDNVSGEALDGTMLINGSYSTKYNSKKPDISFDYDVKGLNVQKTFYTFNTVQKLMPVGQYLDGNLTSQLTVRGKLGDNMMPDLNSLNGEGNILLIEGLLKKFAPLDKLAEMLNVNELKEISLRNIRNHIEFTDGMVLVKPFTVKYKDIEMQIGGMHGFNQTLDYIIDLKLPRALMGSKGNAYVNNLVQQVNDKGVPLKLSDDVNLQVKLGGNIKSPILKMDLKEMAQNTADQLKTQAMDFARAKLDSTKVAVKDSLNSIKKSVAQDLEAELRKRLAGSKDSTAAKSNNLDSAKKRLENVGKGFLQDLLKKKKPADSTRR